MRVSLAWLKELVEVAMPADRLARALTMGGLEVEEVDAVAPAFSGIVVAQVKKVSPHPNADKLRVTEVDAGTGELLTIVCGAPNVAEGQKVACALVGARLPAMEIKRATLRGVEPPDATRSTATRLSPSTRNSVSSSLPALVTNRRSPSSTTELCEGRCGAPDPFPPVR